MTGVRYDQFCALARAAEVVGERWTLLIVRELLLGPKRFADLQARLGGVSSSILTRRLNALLDRGVVIRSALPSPFNAQVYELTAVGEGLRPVVHELVRWGGHFLFPPRPGEAFEPDWARLGLQAVVRHEPTPQVRLGLRITYGGKSADLTIAGGPAGAVLTTGAQPVEATIEAGFDTLLRLIAGDLTLDAAVAEGLARVEGDASAALQLTALFDLRRG